MVVSLSYIPAGLPLPTQNIPGTFLLVDKSTSGIYWSWMNFVNWKIQSHNQESNLRSSDF
jgi:hypothetical protein